MRTTLTPAHGSKFATLALAHVTRAYPNKMDHVLNGPSDVVGPDVAHPIFYGSFDWHSCVHGYWLLTRLLREYPTLPEAGRIRALLDAGFTDEKIAVEASYLAQPQRATFERPYGWAWILMLAGELSRHDTADGRRWSTAMAPLAAAFVRRFHGFLPKATYPMRVGTHCNTAFAITLALDFAAAVGDRSLESLLRDTATRWYATDADCQAWEPGGDDFLSPALMEAECMRRVLAPGEFARWFARFLPHVGVGEPRTLFEPAMVSDRTDGKIGHLDGLNLSRAWCWRGLAAAWGNADDRSAIALDAAERHLASSLPHVAGDYAGEHWLATFALLALTA